MVNAILIENQELPETDEIVVKKPSFHETKT